MTKEKLALEVIDRLKKEYPDAGCTLDYDEAWKLLVSVRLAAQCTDARVNVVVAGLFEKYPSVAALAGADVDDIEKICKDDVIYEQYKELLIGDVLNEQFEDRYLSLFPAKLEQYMENSRKELILENYGVGQLSPVVGYTLPIIKKE